MKIPYQISLTPIFIIALFFNIQTLHSHNSVSLNKLFEENKHSVVKIVAKGHTQKDAQNNPQLNKWLEEFFGIPFSNPRIPKPSPRQKRYTQGLGSGVVMDRSGHIITSYHVIENADEIIVKLSDNSEYVATLVGHDELTDIAVIKIEADQPLKPIKFGNSDATKVGDQVIAIGSPFGFDYSLTAGIISAKRRSLGVDSRYVPFLQSDVAINPGNSGGPLLNVMGEIVGVNAAIISKTGAYAGLSFSIPFNLVKQIFNQLKNTGQVLRGWLGVAIQTLDKEVANALGINATNGILVAESEIDGPAYRAGIRPGDVILSFDGNRLSSSDQLPPMVAALPVDSVVEIELLQNNTRRTIQVVLGQLKNEPTKQVAANTHYNIPLLGLHAKVTSTPQNTDPFSNRLVGLKIQKIQSNSLASAADLAVEDILLSAVIGYGQAERTLNSIEALNNALEDAETKGHIGLTLLREGRELFLIITLK